MPEHKDIPPLTGLGIDEIHPDDLAVEEAYEVSLSAAEERMVLSHLAMEAYSEANPTTATSSLL